MITVIADDLTGAAEIAGICLRYGLDTSFGIDTIPEKEAKVNIIATDSRSLAEDEAYRIHYDLAKKVIQKNSDQLIFKKCDSVLRGHVLTELSALVEVSRKSTVLLQPSNPNGNRCIKNGMYYVEGVEIEKTGFSTDPDFPAKTSSVKRLLLDRSSKKNIPIYTETITGFDSEGIYVSDCSSEADLKTNLKLYDAEVIIGGSAAFFEQYLIKLKIASTKTEPKKLGFSKDYVLVSGSAHPQSIEFAKLLQSKSCPIIYFSIDMLQKDVDKEILDTFSNILFKIYKEHKKLILKISDDAIQFENSSTILKNRLSIVVKHLLEHANFKEIAIEGGASAYSILKTLNWKAFTPTEQLALGVVRMRYDLNPKKHIILKPGSYNWPDGLLN